MYLVEVGVNRLEEGRLGGRGPGGGMHSSFLPGSAKERQQPVAVAGRIGAERALRPAESTSSETKSREEEKPSSC